MIANRIATVLLLVALAGLFSLIPPGAWADESPKAFAGTWTLIGWTVHVVGETEEKEPFGPHPKGRLVMTPEGYWIVIITGANRQPAKTVEEKAALFDSLLAYSGKYTIEGDKVTIRVDMSGNEIFTGPNQVQTRFLKLEEDRLIVRTPEIDSAALPGKKIVGIKHF